MHWWIYIIKTQHHQNWLVIEMNGVLRGPLHNFFLQEALSSDGPELKSNLNSDFSQTPNCCCTHTWTDLCLLKLEQIHRHRSRPLFLLFQSGLTSADSHPVKGFWRYSNKLVKLLQVAAYSCSWGVSCSHGLVVNSLPSRRQKLQFTVYVTSLKLLEAQSCSC